MRRCKRRNKSGRTAVDRCCRAFLASACPRNCHRTFRSNSISLPTLYRSEGLSLRPCAQSLRRQKSNPRTCELHEPTALCVHLAALVVAREPRKSPKVRQDRRRLLPLSLPLPKGALGLRGCNPLAKIHHFNSAESSDSYPDALVAVAPIDRNDSARHLPR